MSNGWHKTPVARSVPFDSTGSGLSAANMQDATLELDGRSIHLRKRLLEADYSIAPDFFAFWEGLQIEPGITLTIEAGASLTLLG